MTTPGPLTVHAALAGFAIFRAVAAGAQVASTTGAPARLQDRLDPATRGAVQATIDSAAVSGIPTGPLVAKALEGAAKQAPGDRIVVAVRALAADLSVARRALGTEADEASLVASAAALRAGISSEYLGELHAARPNGSVAWPLAVLVDLVNHGVPADTAGGILLALARSGATDASFSAFEQEVVHDVGAGVPPGAAAVARTPAGAGHGILPPSAGPARRPPTPPGKPAAPGGGKHP